MTDPVHRGDADRWGGWNWRDPDHGEHFRRCSYCGSIHPEDLAAEPTWHAEWADMKYGWPHKFYIELPNREPDRLFVISSANHSGSGLTHYRDLSREARRAVRRDGYLRGKGWGGRDHYYRVGTRATHFAKFYTVHLADPKVPVDVKETIFRIGGKRFVFHGDTLQWS